MKASYAEREQVPTPVVVALTEEGAARVAETAPVHARGISTLFVSQLDDHELAVIERTLNKLIVDCSCG
jgi:DNA-binding MarR family transcriptional regulator